MNKQSKPKSEFKAQFPESKELRVLFHFSHGNCEVFSVDAGEPCIEPEDWDGECKVSVPDQDRWLTVLGELVLERTRSTEGAWGTFYYVKLPKPLPFADDICFLNVQKDSNR